MSHGGLKSKLELLVALSPQDLPDPLDNLPKHLQDVSDLKLADHTIALILKLASPRISETNWRVLSGHLDQIKSLCELWKQYQGD